MREATLFDSQASATGTRFYAAPRHGEKPFRRQLLKWVGNKQRFADEIVSHFPTRFGTYHEPFLGSGAVMATLAPHRGIGSDVYSPLCEIWQALGEHPERVKDWYRERWERMQAGDRKEVYKEILAAFNADPNGADLLFISRSCYAGIIRFRKRDGYCSTPCGPHLPIAPASFDRRVDEWSERMVGCHFRRSDYHAALKAAEPGDVVYCDPPYSHSQAILYGAQGFSLVELLESIAECKARGVFVALSIDGTRQTGGQEVELPIPEGLFKRQVLVNCGRSMLKRLQMAGETQEDAVVHDRLLLSDVA